MVNGGMAGNDKAARVRGTVLIEEKANCPDIARFERAFGADDVASVPRTTLMSVGIKVSYSHDTTPAG